LLENVFLGVKPGSLVYGKKLQIGKCLADGCIVTRVKAKVRKIFAFLGGYAA
jgi:hypothetical protein